MTGGKRGGTMTSYNDKFDFEIGATEVQNKINEYVCSKWKIYFYTSNTRMHVIWAENFTRFIVEKNR